MTIHRFTAAAVLAALLGLAAGCAEQQPEEKVPWYFDSEQNPWVVRGAREGAPGATPARNTAPAESASPVQYKPDSDIVHPILEAKGNWTVRVIFYHPSPDKGLSALYYANQHARKARENGYDAYVTDLISMAIVSVGSFESEDDPKLKEIWRQSYDEWMKIHGGKESAFRESMERAYGKDTVFGDQPWPVSIIDLQVKMKNAYRIPLTEDDKRRHKEYISRRVRTDENP
jgi:hypothetical protein